MKALYLFPLAFIAGVHGFLIFVPYLALVSMAGYIARLCRRPQLAAVVAE